MPCFLKTVVIVLVWFSIPVFGQRLSSCMQPKDSWTSSLDILTWEPELWSALVMISLNEYKLPGNEVFKCSVILNDIPIALSGH